MREIEDREMKSHSEITYVQAVKLHVCRYAIQNNRNILWSGFAIKIVLNKDEQFLLQKSNNGIYIFSQNSVHANIRHI